MSEFSNVDFTDSAHAYGLHRRLAEAAVSARQVAESAHEVRDMAELSDAVTVFDTARWDIEIRESVPAADEVEGFVTQDDLAELAEYATGLHGVAKIIKDAQATTAEGILAMSDILAGAAFDAHGGFWYDEAVEDHRSRGFSI